MSLPLTRKVPRNFPSFPRTRSTTASFPSRSDVSARLDSLANGSTLGMTIDRNWTLNRLFFESRTETVSPSRTETTLTRTFSAASTENGARTRNIEPSITAKTGRSRNGTERCILRVFSCVSFDGQICTAVFESFRRATSRRPFNARRDWRRRSRPPYPDGLADPCRGRSRLRVRRRGRRRRRGRAHAGRRRGR